MLDETGAPTRNENVDKTGKVHELVGRRTLGILDALDAVGGQTGLGYRLGENARDGQARTLREAAAAQDAGVARLDAQTRGVGGDIGTCLVDHRDDAERHAVLDHAQPVVELASLQDLAEDLGLGGNLPQPVGNPVDTLA